MLLISGSTALSTPRFQALRQRLTEIDSRLALHYASHFYAVDADGEVDCTRLAELLQPGTMAPAEDTDLTPASCRVVVPRLGTISPWASKATDIARNCGFDGVKRIERGTIYAIEGLEDITSTDAAAVDAALHDRMVETVLSNPQEAVRLFVAPSRQASPRCLFWREGATPWSAPT